MTEENRRPLTTRDKAWAKTLAGGLARSNITPNQISVASIVPAVIGATVLSMQYSVLSLMCFALCVQLRLLCNLLDGMVAIEGGKKSAVGALYNEFPDRVADSLFIVALGYAIGFPWVGWLGALLAALTAYVRVFGGALQLPQSFGGIMAKQHRMALITVGSVLGAVELYFAQTKVLLTAVACAIAIGSAVTCVTRAKKIALDLKAREVQD